MKSMRRILTVLTTLLMFLAMGAWAQKSMDQKPSHQMDQKSEKAVHITQGPTVDNVTGNSATITWTTDKPGANHVRYRVAGSNREWKSAYHSGGGTTHNLQLTGLEPSKTYQWQILTRDGDVRQQGQFQTK
jgi:purple acid phosphatase-like protein